MMGLVLSAAAADKNASLWPTPSVPATTDPDLNATEVGVRFQSEIAGKAIGMRFYKTAANAGPHIGNLWSTAGTLLATVTFVGETSSGWQTAYFTSPVSIAANTPYIASYHEPSGRYAVSSNYFAAANGGIYSAPLYAPATSTSTPNGVYRHTPTSAFPNQTYQAENYWVDVILSYPDTGATTVYPVGTALESGSPRAGDSSRLTTDDNSFFQTNSTSAGPFIASWYATFLAIPNELSALRIAFKGKNSRNCTEIISVFNWTTSSWTQLDSRTVGGTEILRSNLITPGAPGDYVSGASGLGEVRVQIRRSATASFNTSADLLSITYDPPSGPKLIFITPSAGQSISGTSVAVGYTTTGDLASIAADHAHFVLDNNPEVMDKPMDGIYQFNNVPAGGHMLRGFLVRADHTYISGTDAVPVNFTTTVPDTNPPSVSVTAPASGATVSGTTTATATATDNVGVAAVQFLIDGSNLGAEDTSPPYSITWNTAIYANGAHTLTARARDGSGNTAISPPVGVTISNLNDPGTIGQWSPPVNWPVVAVNMVLLRTGKVLAYEGRPGITGGARDGIVWDPAATTFVTIPEPQTDLFCSAHSALADGRILVTGGHGTTTVGTADVNIFDPVAQTWNSAPAMAFRRWYPTNTTLPDGRVLVTSGADQNILDYIPIPEVYNPVTNSWTRLNGANLTIPTYPHIYVLPTGKVGYTGNTEFPSEARMLDVAAQVWTMTDPAVVDGGSTVMWEPGRVMKCGSAADSGTSGNSTNTTFVIDMNEAAPRWQQTASMAFPRTHHNATLLPDGNVVVTSGTRVKNGYDAAQAVLEAEMWSPVTKTWTTLAAGTVRRMYHSTALLLPDGRVLVAGSGRDSGMVDQRNYEIYSPPYLFQGARPAIASTPDLVQYGSAFFVGTPDGAGVTSVVLMRPGAVTHMFDMEQRRVPLLFQQAQGGLMVQAPANSNVAPPGYYMLFLLKSGVPSVAKFIRFPAPYEDTQPPTAPGFLSATGNIGTVTLSWMEASDNTAIARYNIHRSTTPGIAPTAANRIAQTTTLSYTDTGLAQGRYYYVATAEDANGNIGQPSNEAIADVAADLLAPVVTMTSPDSGTIVSNSITVSATATDNIAVAGVQFLLDGAPVGAEDTTAPYSIVWTTQTATNGTHQLSARARDTGGNLTTSAAVTVTVLNTTFAGLVGSWSFNESSGLTVSDSSGSQNHGSISGATRVPGRFGNGLSFDGANDMVLIADSESLDASTGLTMEAWIRPAALSNYRTVLMKEVPSELSYALYASSDTVQPSAWVRIGSTSQPVYGTAQLPLNIWTHLAATYDGSMFRVYVNGVLNASRALTGSMSVSSRQLTIGGNAVWGEYFNGLIDEVRLYNRALSAAEIQTDMNTSIEP
jgi:hypothetical protein